MSETVIDLNLLTDELKKMRLALGTQFHFRTYLNSIKIILQKLLPNNCYYDNISVNIEYLDNKIGDYQPQLFCVETKHMVHLCLNPNMENDKKIVEGLCKVVSNSDINLLTVIFIYNDWQDIRCIEYNKDTRIEIES